MGFNLKQVSQKVAPVAAIADKKPKQQTPANAFHKKNKTSKDTTSFSEQLSLAQQNLVKVPMYQGRIAIWYDSHQRLQVKDCGGEQRAKEFIERFINGQKGN